MGGRLYISYFLIIVDGGLSEWSEYDTCSSECGGGIQTSTRSCSNPSPAHGGENCEGETEQTRKCNEQPCPSMTILF